MCYVRESISTTHWHDLDEELMETIWLTLRPARLPRDYAHLTSILGVIYRPPRAKDKDVTNHIEKSLGCILRPHPHSAFMLMGHFNNMKDTRLKSSLQVESATTGKECTGQDVHKCSSLSLGPY